MPNVVHIRLLKYVLTVTLYINMCFYFDQKQNYSRSKKPRTALAELRHIKSSDQSSPFAIPWCPC